MTANRVSPLSALLMTFVGPLVWFMHLSLLYGGATIACRTGQGDVGFLAFALVVTITAFVILLGCGFMQSRIVLAREADRNANSFLALSVSCWQS